MHRDSSCARGGEEGTRSGLWAGFWLAQVGVSSRALGRSRQVLALHHWHLAVALKLLDLERGGCVFNWWPCGVFGVVWVPASKLASLAGMLRKLEIQKEEDLQSVCEVAAHMFSDGVTNWGRVVTLISFGAFVAKHLKSIKQEKCISSLAGIITDALVSSKREWLMSQGGWVSHCLSRALWSFSEQSSVFLFR